MTIDGCFLCAPDHDLIVWESENLIALAGLGPLTEKYYVIGTKKHIRSFADAPSESKILTELYTAREDLSGPNDCLLMTEHGRVPVCRTDGTLHEAHCFHAHVLLFDCSDGISSYAKSYFGDETGFTSLNDAYKFALTFEPYHIVSEATDDITVFTEPLNIPRQLFRGLVAHVAGTEHLVDWQTEPSYEKAKKLAIETRLRLGGYHIAR